MGQPHRIHTKTSKSLMNSCRLARAGVKVFNSSFVAHGLFSLRMKPCSTENFCYGHETSIHNRKFPINQMLHLPKVSSKGMLMTPFQLRVLFEEVSEAARWWKCQHKSDSLWPAALKPTDCLVYPVGNGDEELLRVKLVESVAFTRRHQLNSATSEEIHAGRLLLFEPNCTLSDGYAAVLSGGVFDDDNVPTWGSWVRYFPEQQLPNHYTGVLLAWIPERLLEPVGNAIGGNPEQCIHWAFDVESIRDFLGPLFDGGLR
jgi:hypothetical protein